MNVLDKLDQARAQTNVLQHPFYQRWVAGELRPAELGCYAGEYRHAVIALAEASRLAAAQAPAEYRDGLRRHADEERAHVQLWEQFASAAGAEGTRDDHRPSLPQTRECARTWTAGEDLLEHLAVLYAIEAGQPEVSATKLDGLTAHYGYKREGPAVEYFALHAHRDVEHARQARELIARLMSGVEDGGEQAARMVKRTRAALRGNWRLLDGLQAQAPQAAGAPA